MTSRCCLRKPMHSQSLRNEFEVRWKRSMSMSSPSAIRHSMLSHHTLIEAMRLTIWRYTQRAEQVRQGRR